MKVMLLSLGDVARRVSETIGREVDKGWISHQLKEIDPPNGKAYFPSKRFTSQQCVVLIQYAQEWYHRKGAPPFVAWLDAHNHPVPSPFSPPVIAKERPAQNPKSDVPTAREIQKMIDRAVARALGGKRVSGQIEGPVPNREEDIKPLHNAVVSFSLKHPIEVNECWKWVERLFEQRNNMKVMRSGEQTFPQWLHSSGNMGLMMRQLQGYMDFMHDELTNQQQRLGL